MLRYAPYHLVLLLCAAPRADVRVVWNVPGANVLGAPTHDGKLLTCVDPSSGNLAVLDVATSKLRRLTEKSGAKEFAYFSTPSRDGKHIAYAWFNDAGFYDLRVIPMSGGETRILFRNEEAGFVQPTSWTPDGKHILTLFFRKDNISQIALVDSKTGAVRVLRSLNWVYPKRMDISPDGRWIAYDSFAGDKPGPRDIYLLAIDGSSERKIVQSPAEDLFPAWSPDGTEILFASDRDGTTDAWAVAVKDGNQRLIHRDLGHFLPMGITAAGDLFYGTRTGTTEIVISANGRTDLLPTRTPGQNSAPAWSRDGKRLAYLSRRGAANFGVQSRVIVIRDIAEKTERDVPTTLATIASLRWSPDGEWLLASGSDGKGRSGVFRVRAKDGLVRPEVISETADHTGIPADWNTDGTVLSDSAVSAFAQRRGVTARATATSVKAGSREWPVADATWLEWQGDHLLAAHGKQALLLTPEGVRQLSWKNYDGGPFSVHPDGKTIAYAIGETRSEVLVMEQIFAPKHPRD